MFASTSDARTFALAGNCRVTLVSKATGQRFTYRISQVKNDAKKFFVSLLTGPDNENDYRYLALLTAHGAFNSIKHTAKSCASMDAASFKAISYFVGKVLNNPTNEIPAQLEVHHEGRCGRCNRALTVPASIESGIGPECAKHVTLRCY